MLKKKIILLLFVLVGFSIFAAPDFAAPEFYADDINFGSTAEYGLGGPYPTDNEGLQSLLANPASIYSSEKDFTFSALSTHVKGPVIELAQLISRATSEGQEIATILGDPAMQELLNGIYTGVNITGPLYLGYLGEKFGFGLFNSTDFLIQETGPLSLSVNLAEALLAAAGFAFRIPLSDDDDNKHNLDIGFLLKAGASGEVKIEKSFLELPALFGELTPDLIMGQPFEFLRYAGVDAGIRYDWNDKISLGLDFQDCYTFVMKDVYETGINGFLGTENVNTEYGAVPFKMNAGIEYDPFVSKIGEVIDFRFMAGYDDILDFVLYPSEARNWMLHIKAGAELSLVEIFDIRVGVAEGLLNAGLGIDLKIMKIDAAVFGTERASQPNTNPVYNMSLGFTF